MQRNVTTKQVSIVVRKPIATEESTAKGPQMSPIATRVQEVRSIS